MTFTYPWALLALLVIPVLIWRYRALLRADHERREALARSGLVPAAAGTTGATRSARRGRHLVPACLLATLALLILAAAGPAATLTQVHREGTVILAFDTSNSMRATDLRPDRLAAAKAAAYRFIDAQPRNIRIGVVAFSDTGNVTQSPTDDPRLVKSAVDRLGAHGGTSLGQGLFTALKAIAGGKLTVDPEQLASDPDSVDIGYYGSARVVLLSDGQDTGTLDPQAMARLASVAGVKVSTVGLGDPGGTTVTIDGVAQHTALDEASLRGIAETTDGTYARATSAGDLGDIYAGMKLDFVSRRESTELAPYMTLLSLLILGLGVTVSVVRTGRVVSA